MQRHDVKTWKQRAATMNRREFMQRSVAAGVTIAAASAIWSDAARAQAQHGGHAIFGVGHGATSDTLSVTATGNPYIQLLRASIRNKLVEVAPNGELVPDLATEWEGSADATRWTFVLRDGVEFHNGKPLTTQDVIDSINLHRGENNDSAGNAFASAIADMTADGNTIVFTLNQPNADFPYYLSTYFFQICPSEDGEVDQMSGIGTGPYTLQGFDPGVQSSASKFANYFRDDDGYFESIELLAVLDTAARSNALISGEVHTIDKIDPSIADRLAASNGIRIESVPGGSHATIPMLTNAAPFDDVNVRLALKHAVDREMMRDTIFGGHATLANDHPIAPSSPYHNDALEQRSYDPDRARFHLREAGLDSLDVELSAADAAFVGAVDAGQLYAENARAAGINITVNRVPSDGYWSNVWRNAPFSYAYWNARPTPDLMFSLVYVSGGRFNDTNRSNEQFDALVTEARSETDETLRRELYGEAQAILRDDGGPVIPVFQNLLHGLRDEIGHGEISGAGAFDNYLATRRWWFNA
jgi:peptide/nickel transport system substrate-binding protein